ncbi:hypothetical protein BN2476_1480001 [Paraburkholderia piptadeniae]|uniref:Uncharacterized protein n=1 Tax=Paraburkholderia piptadeniae TaxID=1701573 RepID=A0A1N7SWW8_9BURK|nr:hypothetical protein BN2476_1480001 [Paraburkholderia piptadeniae]
MALQGGHQLSVGPSGCYGLGQGRSSKSFLIAGAHGLPIADRVLEVEPRKGRHTSQAQSAKRA